jgi:acetate kinase
MKVLVCNVGSTSFKAKLYEMPESEVLLECKIERVGSDNDAIFFFENFVSNQKLQLEKQNIQDSREAIELFFEQLKPVLTSFDEIERVGFKTVLAKGYSGVHELTEEVVQGMKAWISIAQSHNEPYLKAINVLREILPGAKLIGCFETAFHQTIPLERKMYAIPYEWYEKYGIHRRGYHGASHSYIADVLKEELGGEYKAISCHLGGSCSICAIENGKSVNTSFGMSLQTGIPHSTRVGDMDCDMLVFLKEQGLSDADIQYGLKKNGGLLGISGVSGDLRYVQAAAEEGNMQAKLAIDVFVHSIVHYIGAFFATMGGMDCLVFTGGIGENSSPIRELVCRKLEFLGLKLDFEKNKHCNGRVELAQQDSRIRIEVIPTNEELGIARRTYEYV